MGCESRGDTGQLGPLGICHPIPGISKICGDDVVFPSTVREHLLRDELRILEPVMLELIVHVP